MHDGNPEPKDLRDIEAFAADMEVAFAHLQCLQETLAPWMKTLSAEERKHMVRTPVRFPKAALDTIVIAEQFPELAAASPRYDEALIRSRLDAVKRIAGLANAAHAIAQKADDAYNLWMAEAYASVLSLYKIGKIWAEDDASVLQVLQPMADLYDARKKPARSEAAPEPAPREAAPAHEEPKEPEAPENPRTVASPSQGRVQRAGELRGRKTGGKGSGAGVGVGKSP